MHFACVSGEKSRHTGIDEGVVMTDQPCSRCNSLCCRHIAIEIDRPVSKKDYDNIRWYLMHKKVSVFVDHKSNWFIKFDTPCENISNNACAIYDQRPKICRDYPEDGFDCEKQGDGNYYKMLFDSEESFCDYLDDKKKNWRFK